MNGTFSIAGQVIDKRTNEFNGRNYYSATIGIIGDAFNVDLEVEQYHELPADGPVRVAGHMKTRNGKIKLVAAKIEIGERRQAA